MEASLVEKFNQHESELLTQFKAEHPGSYADLVKTVIQTISKEDEWYDGPDPDRIHEIDDGDYQGTLVFVIASRGYQPYTYYVTMVGYGSCSGCDTLQAISDYSREPPTNGQAEDYKNLALNIIQKMKKISSWD